MMNRTITSLALAIAFAFGGAAADAPKFRPAATTTPHFIGRYLVAVGETGAEDVATLAAELARTYGGRVEPLARHGFRGFLVAMTPSRAKLLSADPRVQWVEETATGSAATDPRSHWTPGPTSWDSGDYSYDGAGNITAIGNDRYTYDGAGRLAWATAITPGSPENRQSFQYDRNGNLLHVTTTSGDALAVAELTLDFAVAPATNQLDGSCPQGTQGCVQGRYDSAGNQTGTVDDDDYKWDALGMMTEVDLSSRHELYVYDANDERVVILGPDSNSPRRYTLRGLDGKVLREYRHDPAATTKWSWEKDYVYRGSTLFAAYLSGETAPGPHRHYHVDHLATTRLITDADGYKLATLTYWPFGQEAPGSEAAPYERLKFTGHERDTNPEDLDSRGQDLDYMHARYYGPGWGRFLTVDPHLGDVSVPQSWNRYPYTMNNPIRFLDPSGRDCTTLPGPDDGDGEETRVTCTDEITVRGDRVQPTAAEIAFGTLADALDMTAMQLLQPTVGNIAEGLLQDDPGKLAAGVGATAAMAVPGGIAAGRASTTTRVFWSGGRQVAGEAAAAYAESIGGKTLEMTLTGRALEAATKVFGNEAMRPLWNFASRNFAAGASGEVVAVHGPVLATGSTWAGIEYRALMSNASVSGIRYFVVVAGKLVGIP